ncbi:L,D-transpeptidase [Radiobacillus sp. PE A8.2]|uniref:L,D-transpeptidase n=1 Tax=Radiobacillus sp. PE A8.2 TaxID=3380349 RepID=UPI0038904305
MKSLPILFALFLSPLWPLVVTPAENTPVVIVNKQVNQLAYINNGEIVEIYDVATGATEEMTPNGLHTIIVKAIEPYYRKKNIPGGSPDNPLGSRWIGFDANGTDGRIFGIHGTNKPESIGTYTSAGCVRMKNEQVEALFEKVPIGTKVYITRSDKGFDVILQEMKEKLQTGEI